MAVYDFEAELETAKRRANEKRTMHAGRGGSGNAFKSGGSSSKNGEEKVEGNGWKVRVGRLMSRE